MQKLIVTVLGIIFVNSLFTLLPSINGSIGGGTLIVYQFYFNSLFLLSFLLQNRISFPQPEKENVFMNTLNRAAAVMEPVLTVPPVRTVPTVQTVQTVPTVPTL